MCASDKSAVIADLNDSTARALAAVEELTADNATVDVPDETAQRLLLAGVRLLAHKVDNERRAIAAVPASAGISATEIAVTVTELMHAADLNMFDLAMWSGRARPAEDS